MNQTEKAKITWAKQYKKNCLCFHFHGNFNFQLIEYFFLFDLTKSTQLTNSYIC